MKKFLVNENDLDFDINEKCNSDNQIINSFIVGVSKNFKISCKQYLKKNLLTLFVNNIYFYIYFIHIIIPLDTLSTPYKIL